MISATKVPKRIVLSRKGFDSVAGGCASPILDGKLISLPIPEKEPGKGQLRYQGLRGKEGEQIVDLVKQLTKGKKEKIDGSHLVHLDPDLRVELRDEQHAHLPFAFGQSGHSQSELRDIGTGDLFLFFGWFREAKKISEQYEFCRKTPDIFAIWGWLQVEERFELPKDLERAQMKAPHHPHVSHHRNRKNNCLYVASKNLTFLPEWQGAGTFFRFRDGLLLSDKQMGEPNPRKRKRSNWRLPAFFRDIKVSHIPSLQIPGKWEKEDKSILGQAANHPGQEFIFETKRNEKEAAKWLDSIFSGKQMQSK